MTKKGLLKRSSEFKEYEDKTLNYVKERFAKYINPLVDLDLALDIDLSWYNRLVNKEVSFSRIDFEDGYFCNIEIIVRRKEDPEHDLDLKCINFIYPISQIGQTILRWLVGLGICYLKVPPKMLKKFLDDTEEWINKVIDKGYEAVFDEVKAINV